MKTDFTHLNYDEYELFLPSPVFSELEVNRSLGPGELIHETMTIECDGNEPFFTHVQVTGDFLHVSEDLFQGKSIQVPYSISALGYEGPTSLEGSMIFSYLGGETVIPVILKVTEAPEKVESTPIETLNEKRQSLQRQCALYSVQTSKKTFNIDEVATVMVMNQQTYPMTVSVEATDPNLYIHDPYLTINDVGLIKVKLQQTWWDRYVTKKHYKRPITKYDLVLSISHDQGTDQVMVPIRFTTYGVAIGENDIGSDRDYKKVVIKAQMDYNRYIVNGNKSPLNKAIKSVESALAYHGTDVSLWLFYLLLLAEADDGEALGIHLQSLMKYNNFYLGGPNEEFVEVINVLEQWFRGDEVKGLVTSWPMTSYRQLFRLRLFQKDGLNYKDYEALYRSGFHSTHLYAHVAGRMAKKPYVPSQSSSFYKGLLMWAISKDAMSQAWLNYLDKMHHQVASGHLVKASTARHLYSMKPSEGMLRLLVSTLIDEDKSGPGDTAVYLEALKYGIFYRDLELKYIEASFKNRIAIKFDYIHLNGLLRDLDQDLAVYLMACYLKDDLTDKGPHNLVMRHYRHMLSAIDHHSFNEDEISLMAYHIQQMMVHHRWTDIRSDYNDLDIEGWHKLNPTFLETFILEGSSAIGFEWFHNRMEAESLISLVTWDVAEAYIGWIMSEGNYDLFMSLHQKALMQEKSDRLKDWAVTLILNKHRYGRVIGHQLYEEGLRDPNFLAAYQGLFVGTIEAMLDFYKVLVDYEVCSESYMESVLYKGILTRQLPVEVLRVYIVYRKHYSNAQVEKYLNHYFAAIILIDEAYGYESLIPIYEEDLSKDQGDGDHVPPVSLALLRLYQLYDYDNKLISGNLIKNAVKNGIIFPWFASLAQPYIGKGTMRKAAFFAYHSKPWVDVTMYYRCDDQEAYKVLKMKHVFFGFYIGYVMAFYKDYIQYYYEEKDLNGVKTITESRAYHHDVFTEPLGISSDFDVVNTLIMSQELNDEESMITVIKEHIDHRAYVNNEMTIM